MGKGFQLELFKSKEFQPQKPKREKNHTILFAFLKGHEKTVLVTIVSFIGSLIFFSLGVEHGRRISQEFIPNPTNKEVVLVNNSKQINKPSEKVEERVRLHKTLECDSKEQQKERSKYTIQVASFKTKKYAKKEAERLQKKGIETLILPRGTHLIVCVGNFSEKHAATLSLNKLRQIYTDCFVRRL